MSVGRVRRKTHKSIERIGRIASELEKRKFVFVNDKPDLNKRLSDAVEIVKKKGIQ